MAQWYLSYDSTQYGPYDDAQAETHAAANPRINHTKMIFVHKPIPSSNPAAAR